MFILSLDFSGYNCVCMCMRSYAYKLVAIHVCANFILSVFLYVLVCMRVCLCATLFLSVFLWLCVFVSLLTVFCASVCE